MVTGTLTELPFGGTVIVALLTETERLIGGGEKLVLLPQPANASRNAAERRLLNLTILQHLFCHFFCTRPLLQPSLAVQTLELGKSLGLFLRPAEGSIYQPQAIPCHL